MLIYTFKKYAKHKHTFCEVLVHLQKIYLCCSYLKYILCVLYVAND